MRSMRPLALLLAIIACLPGPALGDDVPLDAFPLRNHNPFLQVYGLPTFATPDLAPPGGIDINVSFDVANDIDEADRGGEVLVIDGESRILNLTLRRRLAERFEIGLDVPWVSYSGGALDSVIYQFHDLLGVSNATREGPENQYRMFFAKDGVTLFDSTTPGSGIGDIQVTAAMRWGKATVRAGIKAPTGDPDKLTGSGAADASLAVHGGGSLLALGRDLDYSGFVGVLALGDGEVLAELQRSAVPFAGVALRWHTSERFAIATQVYAQGSYSRAYLDEISGNTFQLAFGVEYRLPRQGLLLRFAFAEDIATAAAPDFAVHLSIRRYPR